MKHSILLILLAFAPFILHSQTVDGINLAEKTEITYLELMDRLYRFKQKSHAVLVDFGQGGFNYYDSSKILDPLGKPVDFMNGIDALNHFTMWGWDLAYQPFIQTDSTGVVVYHYFMKRHK
jgi:hypothetical protein